VPRQYYTADFLLSAQQMENRTKLKKLSGKVHSTSEVQV